MERDACTLVGEIADALKTEGENLRCTGEVVSEDGVLVLTIRILPVSDTDRFRILELYSVLRYIADVGTMRALCARYGIEPEKLERLLPARSQHPGDDGIGPCRVCGHMFHDHPIVPNSAVNARGMWRMVDGETMFHYFERRG